MSGPLAINLSPTIIDWITSVSLVIGACGFAFGGYEFGYMQGGIRQWSREHWGCTRKESRTFVDVSMLGLFTNGEIRTRQVCVEWRVTQ